MDVDTLRQAVAQAGFAAAGVSFLAGLLFSINPVAVAAIPVSLAYVTRAREKRTAILFGGMFIFGLVVTHVLLGVAAGFGGLWVQDMMGRYWGAVLGPLLVLLGLVWLGVCAAEHFLGGILPNEGPGCLPPGGDAAPGSLKVVLPKPDRCSAVRDG